MKKLLPTAAIGLLIAYVLLLLGLTHIEQNARMAADAEQIRLGLEKRAAALSYFHSVRRDDLNALADHRSVTTFFANRDLDMSMKYGLGASLLKMRQAFEQLAEQRRIAGEPVYLRILLREPDGNILVDTHPNQEPGLSADLPLDPDAIRILTEDTTPVTKVLMAAPLHYKGRAMGHVLAWVNQTLAQRRLIAAEADHPGGNILLHITDTPIPASIALPGVSASPSESARFGVWHLPDGGIAGRIPVADTPFELIGSFPPSGISDILSARWFAASLSILAVLILLGAWIAVRMRTDNLVLRARVEESAHQEKILSRKNQDLEMEILKRQMYEQELLQARQDAEAASRAKSEFLATMSHEIRTPLNGVLGMTELLLGMALSDKQQHLAESAHRSGLTLLTLINDILDFSRIEAGRLELEPVPFNLKEVLDDVVRILRVTAWDKGIDLAVQLPASVPRRLIGDMTRLRQVLLNLVGNAVKFTEKGRVAIEIGAEPAGGSAIQLCCAVQDTGIGIPAQALEKVFRSFIQADGSTTRRFGGSGLGLAISQQLVRLMGGDMRVESKVGVGSTFTFTARLQTDRQVAAVAEQRSSAAETDTRFAGRVLVAEDNPVNQEVTRCMLEMLGCDAIVVDDGEAAHEAVAAGGFDLVLMDCHMPGLDGYQATRLIRERETGNGRVPIVALTADVQKETKGHCLTVGMDAYLSKPFTYWQLGQALADWLPIQSSERQAAAPQTPETGAGRRRAGTGTDTSELTTGIP